MTDAITAADGQAAELPADMPAEPISDMPVEPISIRKLDRIETTHPTATNN